MSTRDASQNPRVQALKKPMARVTRVTLFQREIRERLSDAAFDVLLKRAEIISEGQVVPLAKYYGSTMLTLDLAGLKSTFRELMDTATAARVAQMLKQDRRLVPRLKALARKEAERLANARLSNLEMEVKVDAQQSRVLVDLDVEATVAAASKKTRSSPAGIS